MKLFKNIFNYCGAGLMLLAAATVTLNSCTEDIDDSDLYTFTGEMMTDHFVNSPDTFSCYLTLLSKVHSSKKSVSTMKDILSARGNYTCFAPTNEAIIEYLDSLMNLEEPEVSSTDVNEIPDSIAQKIVFNSIIENGNDEAYPSTSFIKGPLGTTNMNDRYISIDYGVDSENNTITFVNNNSKIISSDIKVENGYIHVIDKVLSPSNASIGDVIINDVNTSFFGKLLEMTGWAKKMNKIRDTAWEEKNYNEKGTLHNGKSFNCNWPKNRYIKYTAFVEPDSIFIANNIKTIDDLKDWLKVNAFYGPETSWADDYENEDNAVNQFVSYHLLPEDLTTRNMVTFANEKGRTAKNMQTMGDKIFEKPTVNVWEYWETMGKQRRSIKITGISSGARYINRKSVYSNQTKFSSYREIPSEMEIFGVKINLDEHDTFNGHIYTIEDMLVWNKDVPNKVLNERMRYDVTALFPEFLTNNLRQNRTKDVIGEGSGIYCDKEYLDNIVDMTDETEFNYLVNKNYENGTTWMNYQIDEFNINGIGVDFTLKLPPVPYTGTYEIRYGINANGNRGMAQIYIGKNWKNLPAYGIPLDLRDSAIPPSVTGWKTDESLGSDDDINEADKNMRNLGYMKGPKYIQCDDTKTARDISSNCIRKIIYTGQLEAGETYYIRFKSVLDANAEFFLDYLEFVPKTIYAGDIEAEDKW